MPIRRRSSHRLDATIFVFVVMSRDSSVIMADNSFKDFVLDQLRGLADVRAKAMFGGHGLYQDDRFFGIFMDGRLYFKTDEQTIGAYLERGMGPFPTTAARSALTFNGFINADVAAAMLLFS